MDEIRGIAAGAEVPFELVFMSTLSEEFSDYVGEKYQYKPVETCSDVIINEGPYRCLFCVLLSHSWHLP